MGGGIGVGTGIGTEFGIGIGIVEPRFTPVILSASEGSRYME